MTSSRLALALLAAATFAGCVVSTDEPASDDLEREAEGITSCTLRTATGYRNGTAFTIKVVTIDGKPVELYTGMAYYKMQLAAAKAGVKLWIVSGFRTMEQQKYLYNCYITKSCNGGNLAARPGYSNHQSGHALDLNTSASGVYSWLSKHGGAYGFKRTVPSEPWHWEYWGPPVYGPCTDRDKDGVLDGKDNCVTTANKSQADLDKDGKGDACDGDIDGDGVANTTDNCDREKNATQVDTDKDGKGDACELDDDADGIVDTKDNCPKVKNATQADLDGDGKGDACDTDRDGDTVLDTNDNCRDLKNADQKDTDGDGKGDACDPPDPPAGPPADPTDPTDPVEPCTGDDCGEPAPIEPCSGDECGPAEPAAPGETADLGGEPAALEGDPAGSCSTTGARGALPWWIGAVALAALSRRRRG